MKRKIIQVFKDTFVNEPRYVIFYDDGSVMYLYQRQGDRIEWVWPQWVEGEAG